MYVSNSGFTTRQTIVAVCLYFFVFFKQKTAYEMRISDWSSDVCSSDLAGRLAAEIHRIARLDLLQPRSQRAVGHLDRQKFDLVGIGGAGDRIGAQQRPPLARQADPHPLARAAAAARRAADPGAETILVPVAYRTHLLDPKSTRLHSTP